MQAGQEIYIQFTYHATISAHIPSPGSLDSQVRTGDLCYAYRVIVTVAQQYICHAFFSRQTLWVCNIYATVAASSCDCSVSVS